LQEGPLFGGLFYVCTSVSLARSRHGVSLLLRVPRALRALLLDLRKTLTPCLPLEKCTCERFSNSILGCLHSPQDQSAYAFCAGKGGARAAGGGHGAKRI